MDRCEVKPCKDSSFGTHKEFQDNFPGKIDSGYEFNYAWCKIIEHVYFFTVPVVALPPFPAPLLVFYTKK